MSWHLTSAVAIGVVAALTLAACGSSTESTESASTDKSQPAEATSGGSRSKSEVGSRNARARARILHYGKATAKGKAKATGWLVAAYLFDREGKDWPAACSYLSTGMKVRLKQIGGPGDAGCGKGIEAMTAASSMDAGEARIPEVKELRREGNEAFLIYRTGAGKTNAILMVMEEGEWKLAGINPTHLSS